MLLPLVFANKVLLKYDKTICLCPIHGCLSPVRVQRLWQRQTIGKWKAFTLAFNKKSWLFYELSESKCICLFSHLFLMLVGSPNMSELRGHACKLWLRQCSQLLVLLLKNKYQRKHNDIFVVNHSDVQTTRKAPCELLLSHPNQFSAYIWTQTDLKYQTVFVFQIIVLHNLK